MLFFLKPRVPISATQLTRPINVSFVKTRLFWTFQAFNIVQALGYFLPSNYLPTFTESLGLGSTLASFTLVLINSASIFGCLIIGFLVDRFDVTTILFGLSTLAATMILLIWGFSASIAPIFIFCITYGLTAGGYSVSWGGMVKNIQQKHEGIDTSMLFGLLAAGRGVGAVISGPMSEVLLVAGKRMQPTAHFASGGQYNALIIFCGCTTLVGGGSWIVRRVGLI
nr:hypothetical protein CFP56_21273 [Quercus suber]